VGKALTAEYLPTDDEHWRQALEVQRKLARTGRHRAVGMADLLIAVHAALIGLVLVHYDADFEIAAEFLDFQQRWVVERGSI
jgi:predicted nucleic acid-binding protein